jgi:uncharacterized membrane protein
MNLFRLITVFLLASLLLACAREETPPISVGQYMDDPILLEATVVRCAHDRSATKYDAECVNAREAGNRLASDDREQRRKELEAQSARKRQALRRTQQAATEARRRAAEAQRQREADEYLGIYEVVPNGDATARDLNAGVVNTQQTQRADLLPGNQPGVSVSPNVDEVSVDPVPVPPTDIDSVREELRRRQETSN